MKRGIKYIIFSILGIIALLSYMRSVSAQTCPTQSIPRVQEGLISTPNLSPRFSNNIRKCVIDGKASFAPFKIPSYDDLKSLYFDQNKLTSDRKITLNPTSVDVIDLGATSRIYFRAADFTVSDFANSVRTANTNNVNPAVIFIKNSLYIDENPGTTLAKAGVVFVVGGDVNIDPAVTRIDAVIISSGFIRTAGSTCTQNSYDASNTGALTINGSLISLESTKPPIFCRSIEDSNNAEAAEIIIQQPKYLVILKDLFSNTLQKWSEVQ